MKLSNLEEIFKASQETLNQFLITELPINIFLIDRKGYVCWANKNLLNFVNINSLQEVLGMHISHWNKCRWDAIQEVLITKQETVTEEFYNEAYFSSIRKPVIQNGKLVGVLGLSIDITDKKQSEIAKQQFIMNMAHDLRTPLSGIIGLSYIQSKEGTNVDDRQNGQWIQGAGEQLLELLNLVLEVTAAEHHVENIAKDTIHLQLLAEELQSLMQPAVVSKGLDFHLKLGTHLPLIIADRIKLKRIILNILSNAVKFTKKGKVSLEINLLAIKDNQASIEILISDTGIGIPQDKLDKIFDRFYRAHSSSQAEYTGYGIGLFLVKQAVELLRGEIKVSSDEGKGSCFSVMFTLPLAEETSISEPATYKTLETQSADSKSDPELDKHVLIAEDNTLALHVVKKLLVNLDYQITTVADGKAALNALQTQSFDWALLDIGLPGLTGTDVAKAYRQWEKQHNKPQLPLFALTAHAVDEIKKECEQAGFDYILNKPFTEKNIQIIKLFLKKKIKNL
ncbi:MAG: hypothetical protein RLY40_1477 [Pseudomonadota bacterium]|jgi:signal transduction histidine kinase/ActR/RegA family two-component response regulator